MPYLPTSQAFLEQSAQLLEAYPDTTRITTKYSFPTETPGARAKRAKSQAKKTASSESPSTQAAPTPSAPVAALTLKTYNPTTGIVLQYRTNKIAEVSRLITGLGKLASGADVASLGLSAPGQAAGDVEMIDAPVEESAAAAAPAQAGKSQAQGQGQGQGGKGKKKGGKGKR
ncbi:uncharacterized protein N7482_007027 [Penicillium canariense]|uniref:SRP9 domain-containing protein n=1 Tax=Penicillium canariense TaxID=189055 RepID=A0A9W9LJX7_9EURO|nr:uncharacterized protein N7482_007027 [Penicillium canariense]KAJ5160023.1 hypothetical protein N7482_007027 [Penicillium canariense]